MVAALFGRVVCTVRHWLAQPDLVVDLEMSPDEPGIVATDTGVLVRLPFDWIVDVWGRGIAVVADRLTLQVISSVDDGLRLDTVSTSFGAPQPLTITIG